MEHSAYLMTRPSNFGVSYSINPWMRPESWQNNRHALQGKAKAAWQTVYDRLKASGATVHLMDPILPLPELVFPTNAAIVLDGKALMSSFARGERRREEPVFQKHFEWLVEQGHLKDIATVSRRTPLEGSGDCRWDRHRQCFWAGYGQRSVQSAHQRLADYFSVEVISLELVDPRFYQLSMALCPLPSGEVLYLPEALSADALAQLEARVEESLRIPVSLADASAFNLNLLCVDKSLLMTPPGAELRAKLKLCGYKTELMNVLPFTMAGASVGSLALRLDQRRRRDDLVKKLSSVSPAAASNNGPISVSLPARSAETGASAPIKVAGSNGGVLSGLRSRLRA